MKCEPWGRLSTCGRLSIGLRRPTDHPHRACEVGQASTPAAGLQTRLVVAQPILLALLLSACNLAPRYQRPAVPLPPTYRNATTPATTASLGDEKWFAVFQDPALQKLIRTALQQNYNVQIAASRILQAQAQVGIAQSNQRPTIAATAGFISQHIPIFGYNFIELLGNFSWDIDFWGKYRNATAAARADLLTSQWNQREVVSTLVSNVASAYFQMRELDTELDIARRTLASRTESLHLTQTLLNGGAISLLDVRQAEQLVETAAAAIPDTERQIRQHEDLISTLTGENPHDVPRGLPLTDQPVPPEIPAGLPSQLLARRPDVQAAEQQLIAANANIGVARAAFLPSLPLTGGAGLEGANPAKLATGLVYNANAPLTQQIFTGGRLQSNLRLTEAQEQEMLLTYKQTIQQALQQVSDALIAFQKYREFRAHQEALTAAAQSAAALSEMRYRAGAASYLEVLTNETNSYAAELTLARARLSERLSLVQIYNALGGGWE